MLGLGVRLHRDPDPPVDLLVSSSGPSQVLRNLPLPRRRFTGTYSSILSFRSLAEVSAVVGSDAPRLVLAVASAVGPWRPFGQVCLDGQRGAREDTALAFDPIGNVPAGLRAVGPIARLRDRTYRGSRRARGA